MCIEPTKGSKQAYSLVEMTVATGLFAMAVASLAVVFIFCIRSFAAMSNYAILDIENRQAMDRMSQEIRQAQYVETYTQNPASITVVTGTGDKVKYTFDPTKRTMERFADGKQTILLTNCSLLNFKLYQRNPVGGSYDIYPAASGNWAGTVKVVELTWKTSRGLGGTSLTNSENIQTARIVMRKQKLN